MTTYFRAEPTGARTVNWGILGCAGIAERALVPAIAGSKNGRLYGIASRDARRAADWARRFGFARAYGGYADLLKVAHECSALTAACLVTRRRDYLDVGGMDELRFPVNFNDVDFCLKLRARGQRIVLTPHARLLHLESASRGTDRQPDRRQRFERELQNLRAKWGSVLASDPYYNPMLSLDPIPFSALAWPPRAMDPRVNQLPVPLQVPPGF